MSVGLRVESAAALALPFCAACPALLGLAPPFARAAALLEACSPRLLLAPFSSCCLACSRDRAVSAGLYRRSKVRQAPQAGYIDAQQRAQICGAILPADRQRVWSMQNGPAYAVQ